MGMDGKAKLLNIVSVCGGGGGCVCGVAAGSRLEMEGTQGDGKVRW